MRRICRLGSGFSTVSGQVRAKINSAPEEETANGYTKKIVDDTSILNLKINYDERSVYDAKPDNFMNEGYNNPAVGDYMDYSGSSNTTVEFTGNKTESNAVVYQGSSVRIEQSGSSRVELKEISATKDSGKVAVRYSGKNSDVYILTVSYGGKSGKIILDATQEGSLADEFVVTGEDDMPNPSDILPITFSGSLKVFGADDALVYELAIKDEPTYYEALSYFN
jgi:hypothetical protein